MFKDGILPKSLFGRFLLIIITPTVLLQLIVAYIFYERHWHNVKDIMVGNLTNEIVMLSNILQNKSKANEQILIDRVGKRLFNSIELVYRNQDKVWNKHQDLSSIDNDMIASLRSSISHPIIAWRYKDSSLIGLMIKMPNKILKLSFSYKRIDTPTTDIFFGWMICSSLILIIITLIVSRKQIKAIESLALVAELFGKGHDVSDFKPQGAMEVKKAGFAFLEMKERIAKQIVQRTEILASVSHDLKTILTRLKLQVFLFDNDKKSIDQENISNMQEDVTEMEHIVQEYLDFARGAGSEKLKRINISMYIDQIVTHTTKENRNVILNVDNKANIAISIRPIAFKRAVNNILDNAIRHATKLLVGTYIKGKSVYLVIEDNGPGIPKHERDDVFKPFYRQDSSRNLQTGGSGLGMAIALDIIRNHGGDITLHDSPNLGGLRVLIKIPC